MPGTSLCKADLVISPGELPNDVVSSRTQVCLTNVKMDRTAHIYIDSERDIFHDFHHSFNEQVSQFHANEDSDTLSKSGTICEGDNCLIYDDRNCLWYRGSVVSEKPTTVCVHYIDYGSTRYVSWDHVNPVPEKLAPYFTALPAQAICVILDLSPADSIKAFQHSKELQSRRFRCRAVKLNPGWNPILTLEVADSGLSLQEFLADPLEPHARKEFREMTSSYRTQPSASSPSNAADSKQTSDNFRGAIQESMAEPDMAAQPEPIQSSLNPDCPEFLPPSQGSPESAQSVKIKDLKEIFPISGQVVAEPSDSSVIPLNENGNGEESESERKGDGEGKGGDGGAGTADVGADIRSIDKSNGSGGGTQFGNSVLPQTNRRENGPPPMNNRWKRDECPPPRRPYEPPPRFQRTVCPILSTKDGTVGEGKSNKPPRLDVYVPPPLRNGKAKDMPDILESRLPAENLGAPAKPLLLNTERDCLPMWVEAPGDFYIMLEDSSASFEELAIRLEEFVEKASSTATDLPSPSVGVWVAAPFNGAFYRGIVKELKEDMVSVFFVDYGNTEQVIWSEALMLLKELQQPSPYAIHVKLDGMENMNKADTLALSQKVEAASKIRCRFVSFEGPKFQEKYAITVTTINGDVDDVMQQQPEEPETLKSNRNEDVSIQTSLNAADSTSNTTLVAQPPSSPLPSDAPAEMDDALLASPQRVAPAIDTPIKCKISSFNSCKSFWLQLYPAIDSLPQLRFGKDDGGIMNPMTVLPGVHCLVRADDGFWYRARILQIIRGPKAGLALTHFPSPQVRVRFVGEYLLSISL